MIKGSCACGLVQYQVKKFYGPITFCHCDDCKRTSATAFSSNVKVKESDFEFTQGADALQTYKPFPDKTRYFCRRCGSHIMHRTDDAPGMITIKLGTVTSIDDFDPEEYERYHIFCKYDTPWTDFENCEKYPEWKEIVNGKDR